MDEMNFLDLLEKLKQLVPEVENDEEEPKKERVEYKHIRTDYVDITCRTPVEDCVVREIEKTYPDCNFDNAILSNLLADSLVCLGTEIYENGNKSDKDQFKRSVISTLLFMKVEGWLE